MNPGIGGFPGAGNVGNIGGFPMNPGIGGIPGPGIGGFPTNPGGIGGFPSSSIGTCSQCGRTVSGNPVPSRCPHCGIIFVNRGERLGASGGPGVPPVPGNNIGGLPPSNPPPTFPTPSVPTSNTSDSSTNSSSSSGDSSRLVKIIVGVIAGCAILAGAVIGIVQLTKNDRKPRRARDDYDDDDDGDRRRRRH